MKIRKKIGVVLFLNILIVLINFIIKIEKDINIYVLVLFNLLFIVFEIIKNKQHKRQRENDRQESESHIDLLARHLFQKDEFNHYYELFEKKIQETGVMDYALLTKALHLDPNNVNIKEHFAIYKITKLLASENLFIDQNILERIRGDVELTLNSFLKTNPENASFLICKGILEDQKRQYIVAQKFFKKAKKYEKKSMWAIHYGRSMLMSGNPKESLYHTRSFIKMYGNNPLTYLYLADIHLEIGNFKASERYYLLAAKSRGRKSLLELNGLSSVYNYTGEFRKLLLNDWKYVYYLNNKSLVFIKSIAYVFGLSLLLEPIKLFFKISSRIPFISQVENPILRADIYEYVNANRLLKQQRWNGAIYLYKKALLKMPKRMDTYNNLAIAYHQKKNYHQAASALSEGFKKITGTEIFATNFTCFFHDYLCKHYNLPVHERKMRTLDEK